MTVKSDALTRLVERTTGQADIAQPVIRPMFSPAVLGNGPSTQPAVITMDSEISPGSISNPAANFNSARVTGIRQPLPEISRELPDNPLIDSSPASPGWKRERGAALQKKAVPGQEQMANTPGHRASPGSRPLLPPVSAAPPAGRRAPSGSFTGSKGDELFIGMKGSRAPDNVKTPINGDNQPLDVEVNIANRLFPGPLAQFPLLSVDAAESFSLAPGSEPFDKTASVVEPLKSRRRFQTGLYTGKESGMAGEPAAPLVRVAIGRIEVRAVLQQPPVQQPAPAPDPVKPALSLDEYLRQRDGGER